MQPVISIIIPFKNEAQFLGLCLESILNQTFSDWECILLNDHSTDESPETARRYAGCDERFKYFENPGQGIIAANVFGLSVSSGKYVTRMDADDLMPENKLEILYKSIKNQPPGTVVTGKVKFFPDEACGQGTVFYENWLNRRCDLSDHASNIWRECTIASPNWLMQKTDLLLIGGFNNYEYPEDYEMAFKCVLNNYKIIGSKEVTHLWRQHSKRHSKLSENYSAEQFMKMKWKYFKQIFPEFLQRKLIVIGNLKKSKILQKILITENIDYVVLDIHNANFKSQLLNYLAGECYVISTLSGIDNHDDIYCLLDAGGYNYVRFC